MVDFLIFFIMLSVLVLVHEFGHFIAAKKNNIYVEEFGFGLPPRIFGVKKGETMYSVNFLPFGGFVKLLGEEEAELTKKPIPETLKKRTFAGKSHFTKLFVIVAGVLANFLLGWVVISYLFTQGVPVPTYKVTVSEVIKGSPAERAGIKKNDVIVEIFKREKGKNIFLKKLTNTEELIGVSKDYVGSELIFTISRGGKQQEVMVVPRANPPKDEGPLGVAVTSFAEKKYPWFKAPFFGLVESVRITAFIVNELAKIVVKLVTFQKISVDVAGPVGIFQLTSKVAKFGTNAVLQLLGLLSFNLAIINILPFPALDGGRLSFIIYEWVTKKKIRPIVEQRLNLTGFIILISLIILVTINDIIKTF